MDRPRPVAWNLFLIALTVFSGCQPTQPFFLNEDGDLSHYLDQATEMEMPDLDGEPLPDASHADAPLSLLTTEPGEFWDLSLEEAISISLQNSKVIRSIAQVRQTRQVGQSVAGPPEGLTINPEFTPTIYDTAIEETGPNGAEAALAAFDTQWNTNLFWDQTDRPQNVNDANFGTQIFARLLEQDNMNFESELTKRSATGTQWSFRNVTTLDQSNRPLRVLASEWLTSFEAEARHPLMRGGGAQVNRVPVLLGRIRTDISLVQFSQAIRNHLIEVERAYRDVYFFYRNLETARTGFNSALGTWKRINAMYVEDTPNVTGEQEAQSREQYYFFRGRLEEGKRDLLIAERQLRFLMGIAPSDGRVIRPIDQPTLAKVEFDWSDILTESLTRSEEIRRQKWLIKQRELELIAARNNLLPQVDVVALYRWLGIGDDLIEADRNGLNFPTPGSTAFDELTEGRFQEWRLGIDVQLPLGARAAHASVRNQQLLMARDRARLEDLELEVVHGLSDAIQRLDANFVLTKTAFQQWAAGKRQVDVLQSKVESGSVTLDLLLDAQRRAADAERAFLQSLLQYNNAIVEVHYRKGSLIEYCGVVLQEGPWPAKAYFDALIRARQRDASHYLDYGYTRPRVISRGKVSQSTDEMLLDAAPEATPPGEPELAEPVPASPEADAGRAPQGPASPSDRPTPDPSSNGDEPLPAPQDADSPRTALQSNSRFEWDEAFE